jgi:uncharacterized integral membrane protein
VTEPTAPGRRNRTSPSLAEARASGHLIAAVVVALLLIVLAAQNSTDARIRLLLWRVETPLYALVAISGLSGAVVAIAVGGLLRHRRHVHTSEHRELLRLRRRPTRRAPRSPD